jgi:nitroreductase
MTNTSLSTLQRALRQRRSVRHFSDEIVSGEVIASLVEDASWAPSGGDEQPWAVTAVRPASLAPMLERYETDGWLALTPKIASMIELATKQRLSPEQTLPRIFDKIESEGRVRGRPWALFVHTPKIDPLASRVPEYQRAVSERFAGRACPSLEDFLRMNGPVAAGVVTASAVCFAYALTLSASARGLGTCIQHSWLMERSRLQSELEIPAERELQTVILVGVPDRTSEALRRAEESARRRPVSVTVR